MRGFLLVLALLLFPGQALGADADVLASLREKGAALTSLVASFTQETRIPMFDAPVISTGRMVFKRPDGVRWEYTAPMREGFAMRGGKGSRWRDGAVNSEPFSVSADPVLSVIARQLLAWVTLDLARIEKEYTVAVTGENPAGRTVTLTLTPRRADVADVLRELVLVLTPEGVAESVTIEERRGGVTRIRFTDVAVNAPVGDEEFP